MSAAITLVSGFGRCGSSLVMQMLAAGGMPATGDYPTFEATCPGHIRGVDWWPSLAGKALKVLDPTWGSVPGGLGCRYRAIWLDRDPAEQAKSWQKFSAMFLPVPMQGRESRRALMASYRKDRPGCLELLRRRCEGRVLELRFERILSHPAETAQAINAFIELGLDVAAMAAAVRPRPPRCLPDFLELDLMAEAAENRSSAAPASALPP